MHPTNQPTKEGHGKGCLLLGAGTNKPNISVAKVGIFFRCTNEQTNKVTKTGKMEPKTTEKVTRDRLRAMKPGETFTVQCANGYDLDSQKNTAYAMKKLEGRAFACRAEGLTLTVTCNGVN